MPTKVLDVDFNHIPTIITGLDEYPRAMALVRIRGKPVERLYVPIVEGVIQGDDLRRAILRNAKWPFWKSWMQEILSYDPDQGKEYQYPETTIAVCTRDRADDLRRCLEALTQRYGEKPNIEILVVDNCSSSSATKETVEAFPGVRYAREERPGLNRARNKALREARYDIVAFIDDDALPDANWLQMLTRNFCFPGVACATGLTMPIELETPAQEAFEQYTTFSRGFFRQTFDWSKIHPIGAGVVGAGTNMALRRSVLEQVGLFDEALDAGTPTFSGGDTEMISRLLAAGYQIIYDPCALNWHRHRRSWKELRRAIYGYGVGVYAFWTRKFLVDREWYVIPVALRWLFTRQIPTWLRSVFRLKNAPPLDLISLEIWGCLMGPWAYLKSRRQNLI
jgi:glycosyltransferase involved in cell wall biosynthesis